MSQNIKHILIVNKNSQIVASIKGAFSDAEEVVTSMRMRKEGMNFVTPVLVASASLNPEVLKNLSGKVQGFIVKPLDLTVLCEKVKKLAGA